MEGLTLQLEINAMATPVDAIRHRKPLLKRARFPAGNCQHQDFQDLGIVRMGAAL